MKIMFMGTPDFAVPSLAALAAAGHEIVAVVTGQDKPRGRGCILSPTPVKAFAQAAGLPVYQPLTLRDGAAAALLEETKPDAVVVVAFGKILPPYVLQFPRLGCINVHGSLLPAYRGAAPMQRAIMNGDSVTGVTVMYMAEGIDTGDMIAKACVPIGADEDFEVIHDRLAAAGAELLVRTLAEIEAGRAVREKQDDAKATYAPKITKEELYTDFSAGAFSLHCKVRGTSPFPLSYTKTPDGKLLKIVRTALPGTDTAAAPGTVCGINEKENSLRVACGDGKCIDLAVVIPEGRAKMNAADLVHGRRIKVGDILG